MNQKLSALQGQKIILVFCGMLYLIGEFFDWQE